MIGKVSILWNPAHKLAMRGGICSLLGKILERINMVIYSHRISERADVGENTIFMHGGLGCVIGSKAKIGDNCVIFQHVTIGSKWSNAECERVSPSVGNNVMIGANSIILGNIAIGNNSIIGANAVVLQDVPDNSIAVGVPAKILKRENVKNTDETLLAKPT